MTWLDDSIYVMLAAFLIPMILLVAKWLLDSMSRLGRGLRRITLSNVAFMAVILLLVFSSLWEISQFAWYYGIEGQDPFLKVVVLVALAFGLLVTLLGVYRSRRQQPPQYPRNEMKEDLRVFLEYDVSTM